MSICFSKKPKSRLEGDFGVNSFLRLISTVILLIKKKLKKSEILKISRKIGGGGFYTKNTFLHPEISKKANVQKWYQKPFSSFI